MKPGYAKKTNLGIIGGMVIGIAYVFLWMSRPQMALSWIGSVVGIASSISFVWGCCMYAAGKGYHPAWGVLGLGNLFGLAILAFLPDRHPQAGSWKSWVVALVVVAGIFVVIPTIIFMSTFAFLLSGKNHQQRYDKFKSGSASLEAKLNESMNYLLGQTIAVVKDSKQKIQDRRAAIEVLRKSKENSLPFVKDAIASLEGRIGSLTNDDTEILGSLRDLEKPILTQTPQQTAGAVSYFQGKIDESKTKATVAQLGALKIALEMYHGDNGIYPSTEQGLKALYEKPTIPPLPRNWNQCLPGPIKDSWGHEFVYAQPGKHNTISFDIYSQGQNGIGDGDDPDDLNNWK